MRVLRVTPGLALSGETRPALPSITSMSPLAAAAGGSQLVLTVNGDVRHDSAKWNGFAPVDSVAATMENHVQMGECEPLF